MDEKENPILITGGSADAAIDVWALSMEAGMNHYPSKLRSPNRMIETVNGWLEKDSTDSSPS